MLPKIFSWSAKRSGATITIKGKSEMGFEITITEVVEIKQTEEGPEAVTAGGDAYQLS